ncbi:MAG: DnaJ domain-containing protein [Gammaproteobacteria bacterium]
MFPRFIIVIAALVLLFLFLRWFSSTPPHQVAARLKRAALWLAVAVLVFLAVSGRLPWLFGLLASLALFAKRLLPLLRHVPLLAQLLARYRNAHGAGPSHGATDNGNNSAMSREQAYEILGLEREAGRDEIIAAHRRLMQKLHPDRSGSTYLAAQINRAKAVLLSED